MADENKLKLDDITFDDFISDGLTTEVKEEKSNEAVVEKKEEVTEEEIKDASKELDDDVEEKVVEEEKEVVSKKKSKPEPIVEEEVENEEVEETVVNEVLSQLGYEFPDEQFEDTSDGLAKLAKAVGMKMAEDQLDGLFNAYPEVQKHLDYLLNGGKSEDWMKSSVQVTDFENIKVTQDDLRTQRAVLGEYFKLKGHDAEFINELLDDYTETNKLYDKAVKAKTALNQYYVKERDTRLEQQKREQLANQQRQREFWDDINDTIQNSKDFAGITVPERDKNKFFDYLSKPGSDGKTAREKAHQESSKEVKLAIDYLMFKGFNLKDIIATKAKTSNAKSLRKKLKSTGSVKGAARPKRKGGFDIESLDLNLSNL
tara:strand:- start:583 stop:1698 length:1116 start_codon:yes stop_codon:yes gene_type:complete